MKKRLLSVLLAASMAVGLAACGGDSPKTNGGGSENAGQEAQNAGAQGDDGEVWTCVVPWPSVDESGEPEGIADVEAAVNAITVPEIGVQVELAPIYCYNLNQQQTLAVSSREKMDLICCMLETNASYIKNGSIIPLTDLYEQYGTTIQSKLGEAVEACALNGVLYTIPTVNLLGNSYGFVMRSDLMEKYGYSAENQTMSTEEFGKLLAAVKEGEGAGFYPVAGLPGYQFFMKYDDLGGSASAGVIDLNGDTDKVINLFASDAYKAYADLMYEWAQAGYVNPDASFDDAPAQLVAAGNYGGQFISTQPGQELWVANMSGYEMTAITFEGMDIYSKTTDLSNLSWGISSVCDNPEKAMQLLDLMFADNEIGTILTCGLEGKTHVVLESDDEGHKIIDYPEGRT